MQGPELGPDGNATGEGPASGSGVAAGAVADPRQHGAALDRGRSERRSAGRRDLGDLGAVSERQEAPDRKCAHEDGHREGASPAAWPLTHAVVFT